ncbi:MAG TPA: hypothetical protein VJ085_09950, partial [Candidatus Acidoferrales bacterium]|nr:hypothetical protein [Candidatus Acidoferrales bacterium]
VWVYLPDPAARNEPVPPAPRLPVFSERYRMTHLAAELPSNVDHGIIGLMDPAHGPFVHQSWWWRTRRSIQVKEKIFEPIPSGFRIRAHQPSANSAPYKLLRVYGQPISTTIDFVLPNMRFEQIRYGPYWFSSRATVTPITAERCRIFLRRLEHLSLAAVRRSGLSPLCQEVSAPGPGDDGKAGAGLGPQPGDDAGGRRRPARQVVLPAQGGAPGGQAQRPADAAPHPRPRYPALAQLALRPLPKEPEIRYNHGTF